MKAARWRIAGWAPWDGGDLAINALHLYSAETRVDAGATLRASHEPTAGQLADIAQPTPGAAVVFAAADVWASGFYLEWEFPAEVEVDGLRVAGRDFSALTVYAFVSGAWLLVRAVRGLRGLSVTALTPLLRFCVREPRTGAVACMAGDTAQDAVNGGTWNIAAGASLQTVVNRGGVPMLRVQGASSVNLAPMVPAFTNWSGSDITVEATILYEAPPEGDTGMPLLVFCGESAPGTVYWSFGPSLDDSLAFYYWSGVQNYFRTPAKTLKRNQLTHIAVSIQGMAILFFVDGKLVHTATRATTPVGGGSAWPLRIGCTAGPSITVGSFAVSDVIFTPRAKYTTDFALAEQWDVASRILTRATESCIGASSGIPAFTTTGHRAAMACDMEFGGSGQIYGSVARKALPVSTPLSRRVRLHRSIDGLLVRETWSKSDGSYRFDGINERYEYDVIAWDNEMSYRSVVANNLTPEAM